MPTVDLSFTLVGNTLAHDHGYELYSALCSALPDLHGSDIPLAILPIRGHLVGNRQLALRPNSRLVLRLPSEEVWRFVALAGKTLNVGDRKLQIGTPTVSGLIAHPRLYSALVTFKGYLEAAPLLDHLVIELERLGVKGNPTLPLRVRERSAEGRMDLRSGGGGFIRRTLRIKHRQIVGYAVQVDGLDDSSSLRLQEVGLGGRRRMGAGVFLRTATLKPSIEVR